MAIVVVPSSEILIDSPLTAAAMLYESLNWRFESSNYSSSSPRAYFFGIFCSKVGIKGSLLKCEFEGLIHWLVFSLCNLISAGMPNPLKNNWPSD